MKNLKMIFFSVAFLAAGLSITSCGGSNNADKEGKEYTSVYVCPMHCDDSGSDAAGKCPVCGMDYVKNTEHKSDGHKH